MTGRQLKVIFATLALLVVVYVAVRLAGNGGNSPGGPDIAAVGPDVESLLIIGPGTKDSIRLRRTPAGWTVNGYPADSARIGQALSDLGAARPGRLVARKPANHARLGLTTDSARRVVVLADGSTVLEFLLGKGGADGRYVRLPDSDDVYTVPASSVQALDRSTADWRDRRIAAIDTGSVVRIVVRRDDDPRPTDLVRHAADSTDTWSEAGLVADSTVVRKLLETVTDLQANGFPSDSVVFAVDFADPAAVLELYDSGVPGTAPRIALLFLTAPDARDFLVRRASDPLVFRLGSGQVEKLLPARATLFQTD